jgi:hypothetical protein
VAVIMGLIFQNETNYNEKVLSLEREFSKEYHE